MIITSKHACSQAQSICQDNLHAIILSLYHSTAQPQLRLIIIVKHVLVTGIGVTPPTNAYQPEILPATTL
jgi:hypothetical protein